MKRTLYAIVIIALLTGCAKQPVPANKDAAINAAEPRLFHGSDIVDCKNIHQQHDHRED